MLAQWQGYIAIVPDPPYNKLIIVKVYTYRLGKINKKIETEYSEIIIDLC